MFFEEYTNFQAHYLAKLFIFFMEVFGKAQSTFTMWIVSEMLAAATIHFHNGKSDSPPTT
jgi:hypothetical protein